MTSSLKKLFGPYREAVVAVKNGTLVFRNGAAQALIPELDQRPLDEIFPPQLLEHDSDAFVGAAEFGGRLHTVTVSALDGYKILTVFPLEDARADEAAVLLSAASTKMREYLSMVKMSSGLLMSHIESLGDDRLSRFVSMIEHNCYCMERAVDNIDLLSRRAYTGAAASMDLVALYRDLVESAEHLVDDRGIKLSFMAKPDEIVVCASRAELEKLLLNLLSNSIKHTPAGGTIEISLVRSDDRTVLSVRDTGSGIPEDELFSVWNRYCVPTEQGGPPSGMGLGLSIVQQIARANGGSAVLESKPGAGTTVTVVMYLRRPDGNKLHEPSVPYGDGMQAILRELAEVIGYGRYTVQYLD